MAYARMSPITRAGSQIHRQLEAIHVTSNRRGRKPVAGHYRPLVGLVLYSHDHDEVGEPVPSPAAQPRHLPLAESRAQSNGGAKAEEFRLQVHGRQPGQYIHHSTERAESKRDGEEVPLRGRSRIALYRTDSVPIVEDHSSMARHDASERNYECLGTIGR
jgi:hypothetical protein